MSRDPMEAFLNQLHHPMLASIDLSLDRMHRLLAMLGNPHKRLPPVIHVAGTNGKGSLLANLQSILQVGGYRVHKYTSPHLVRFRERIVLNGKEIDDAYIVNIVKHVSSVLQSQPATFFEATTAAAFLAFAEIPADVLLLETGMGGRLDATNVIDKPVLTAITPIAFDHTEYLGKTLAAIAGEKAGIIKYGVPCVISRQEAEAMHVLEKKSSEMHAPHYRMGHEWQHTHGEYKSNRRVLQFSPALVGDYQYDNTATAIACLDMLPQFKVSDTQIAEGISKVVWPARLQLLTTGALPALVADHKLWLDGGHNPQGGQVLGAWMAEQKQDIYLVCGMMKGKDAKAYLTHLAPYVKELHAVAIPDEAGSHSSASLAATAKEVGINAHEAASVEKALQTISSHAKNPSILCICGSLYLAGHVLHVNASEKAI
jgi:dihydrofolate synthase/folylpolyglutamate synthase